MREEQSDDSSPAKMPCGTNINDPKTENGPPAGGPSDSSE
jgi:hypothetical protein